MINPQRYIDLIRDFSEKRLDRSLIQVREIRWSKHGFRSTSFFGTSCKLQHVRRRAIADHCNKGYSPINNLCRMSRQFDSGIHRKVCELPRSTGDKNTMCASRKNDLDMVFKFLPQYFAVGVVRCGNRNHDTLELAHNNFLQIKFLYRFFLQL